MSNSSAMPVPIAVMIAWISAFESTLLRRFFSLLMTLPRSGRMAWKSRSRASTAEPPAELPSTRNSSADSGSFDWQSASLPGSEELSSADLRRVRPRAHRRDRLVADRARILRVLFQETGKARVDGGLDETLDARIAELRLRLAIELRVAQLDREDRGETLADVLAVEALLLLQELQLGGLGIQRTSQRAAEPGQVGTALDRVDVVGECEDRLLVGGVPLHRHLDTALKGSRALIGLALEVDDVLVDRVLGLVDVRDEVADPALVLELDGLAVCALVDQLDVQALREERGLAQPLCDRGHVDVELLEHLRVGQEGDRRPRRISLGHLPDDLHVAGRVTPLEFLPVDIAVAAHLGDESLGERVHDRDADAVQAARDLVAVATELPAGMELREDDRQRRQSLIRHHVDRYARAPILDRDGVVRMEGDLDPVVAALERLVDRVVDDLVDEVMQSAQPGRGLRGR